MRHAVKKKQTRSPESGAALILVVTAVMMAGILTLLSTDNFRKIPDTQFEKETAKKMDRIVNYLAAYVQKNDRLPCPARPNVLPTSATFGVESGPPCLANPEGIIPFRTLNIDIDNIKDAWGHNITYGVNPVFTDTTSALPNSATALCRTSDWKLTANGLNKAPLKARFCCPPQPAGYTDLTINNATGSFTRATDTAGVNTFVGDSSTPPPSMAEIWAMVLISHGKNGFGAYLVPEQAPAGAVRRVPFPPVAVSNPLERENGDTDAQYEFYQTVKIQGTSYFDDIVVGQTQYSLYSRLNSGTCRFPWH